MIVLLRSDAAPELTDATNLRGLHAELAGVGDPAAVRWGDLCGPGPDPDHVWVSIDRLRAAVLDADPASAEAFDGVIAYASGKGWLDESGSSVRAHVERLG